jgi:hypothetical protein
MVTAKKVLRWESNVLQVKTFTGCFQPKNLIIAQLLAELKRCFFAGAGKGKEQKLNKDQESFCGSTAESRNCFHIPVIRYILTFRSCDQVAG